MADHGRGHEQHPARCGAAGELAERREDVVDGLGREAGGRCAAGIVLASAHPGDRDRPPPPVTRSETDARPSTRSLHDRSTVPARGGHAPQGALWSVSQPLRLTRTPIDWPKIMATRVDARPERRSRIVVSLSVGTSSLLVSRDDDDVVELRHTDASGLARVDDDAAIAIMLGRRRAPPVSDGDLSPPPGRHDEGGEVHLRVRAGRSRRSV